MLMIMASRWNDYRVFQFFRKLCCSAGNRGKETRQEGGRMEGWMSWRENCFHPADCLRKE